MVFRNHWRYRFGIILMPTFLTIKMVQYQSPYQKALPINQSECSMFKFEKMIHFIDIQMRFKLKSSNKFQFFIHQIFYLPIHHFLLMIVIWRRIGSRKCRFSENSNFRVILISRNSSVSTRNKILYPHNEYSDQIITVYSTEKQSILCWWMLRPDQVQLPSILGGPTNQKAWKCINHCAIDRITSITSHALPGKCIQITTYSIFIISRACGMRGRSYFFTNQNREFILNVKKSSNWQIL